MARRLGMVCAGVLLVAVTGCALDSFLVPGPGPAQKLVVAAPVKVVDQCLQQVLADAGIAVRTNLVGDDYRTVGQTRTGKIFCFHLRREKGEGPEKTHVTLIWDKEVDEDFWHTIVQALGATAPG
jgi:hypothetical protein